MGMVDLGHGVSVSEENGAYFKVITNDPRFEKKDHTGQLRRTAVTVRPDEKHGLLQWPLTEEQKEIITNYAKVTIRKRTKKEMLDGAMANDMQTIGQYEHISPEEAKTLFQDNVVLRNEILRSQEFADAVQEAVKQMKEAGDGSLLDSVLDDNNVFDDDEEVDENEILKEELDGYSNESESNEGSTGNPAPKTREAINKKPSSGSQSKGGRKTSGSGSRKTNSNATRK